MSDVAVSDRGGSSTAATLPLISVVTVCRNAEATIERTLDSVAKCDYARLQYIVVDGESSDGTLDRIRRHGSRIDKFITEPDSGISDALNKAVALSDGEYHLVVHADDALVPESLPVLAAHAAGGSWRVVSGSVQVCAETGVSRTFVPDPRKLLAKMSVPHMGSLIQKEAWEAVGGYDVRRRIAMDHLLMLRIINRFGVDTFGTVDVVVAKYFLGGVSDRMVDEGFRELRENLREEGVGAVRAQAAYVTLLIKARLARLIGRK